MENDSDSLKKAVELIKAGNKTEAQRLLESILKSNMQNLNAWLWYVETWSTTEQKVKALELCLRYNPDNEQVKRALQALRANQAPIPTSSAIAPTSTLPSVTTQTKKPRLKKCPYCAEEIQEAAVVCRYCRRDLATGQVPKSQVVIQSVPVQQQPQTKKGNPVITFLAALGLLALACICLVILGRFLTPITPATYHITYKVTGTASRASLTFANEQGGTEQSVVRIPSEGSFTAERGQFLYLSAQNEGESGSVTCEIWVDGVKRKESTSRGAYVISTCSGLAGGD